MFQQTDKTARAASDHEIAQRILTGEAVPVFISQCSIREEPDLVADRQASHSEVGKGSVRKHALFDLDEN